MAADGGAGVAAPARITLENAMPALEQARVAMRAGGGALDLAPLVQFDSAAVAVLVALRREEGAGSTFRNPPRNLRTLASLYGVEATLFGPPAP